jgi:2-aminoethylphosphonate-pyruvate transaminase
MKEKKLTTWKDKILFTPGPLTTSRTVKQSMLRDLGSRDYEFIEIVRNIRTHLLNIAGVNKSEYEAIIMQGSGTYGLESVVASTIPPDGKFLVIINGAYGRRIAQMARIMKIETKALEYPENVLPDLEEIEKTLKEDKGITNVCVVHCETTTGIINPIKEIGEIVNSHGRKFFVDAMTTFGAMKIDFKSTHIDYLVTSANKCLEGVPGCSLIIAKTSSLLSTEGYARSLSMDVLAQLKGLESDGQFRFTPPIQVLMALSQALDELEEEGGIEGRAARYKSNYETLLAGMRELGFIEYLFPNIRGYIITSFLNPVHPNYSFAEFYKKLNERDQVIYPGKLSTWDGFRIGTIGRITSTDVKVLLNAIRETLEEMNVQLKPIVVKER